MLVAKGSTLLQDFKLGRHKSALLCAESVHYVNLARHAHISEPYPKAS